ncbi:MAG: subtilase family serine protease [Bradymonadia bacterium]|jgi:subtilase family serine protease
MNAKTLVPLFVLLSSGLFAACGGSEEPGPKFSAEITQPTDGVDLFTEVPVTFAVELIPAGSFDPAASEFVYDWDFGDGSGATGAAATIEHVYAQSGQIGVSVTARQLDGTNTIAEAVAEAVIAINPASDLAIDAATLTLTTAVVRSDTQFRVSGNLFNLSDARAPGAFTVGYFIGDSNVISEESVLDPARIADLEAAGSVHRIAEQSFDSFEPLPAQAIVDDQTLSVPETVESGEYIVFLFADPDGTVGETDESNNVAFASRRLPYENSSGDGPDLQVTDVLGRPALTNILTTVTLNARIANIGTVQAQPFDYTVYLSADNPTLQEDDRVLFTGRSEGVATGDNAFLIGELPITIDPPVTEIGTYYVLLRADSGDEIEELSEGNNISSSGQIRVTDEDVPGADLVPIAFAVLPGTTFVGGSVQIDLTVANQGTQDITQQYNCKFYFSEDAIFDNGVDKLVQTMLLSPLQAGEEFTQSVDAFVPPMPPGEYTPIVACDPSLLIAESDDANNVRAAVAPIFVAAEANVDLRTDNFDVEPLAVDNGDPVTVSVDVCNDGSNGSTPSIVRVYLSEDPILDLDDSVLLESRVPPIDAGACVTVRAEVPASCDTFISDYTLFAAADVTQLVAEASEENNISELGEQLSIGGLICACELDALEPDDSPATASFLNPEIGTYEDLTMCDANVDYYLLPLLDQETVRVSIEFDSERGDLEMTLFALDYSTELDSSSTAGDREEVSYFRVPGRGSYLLRVQGETDEDRNVYDLQLDVSSPDPGTDLIVLDVEVDDSNPVLGATLEVCFNVVNLGDITAATTTTRVYLSEDLSLDPIDDPLLGELILPEVESRVLRCLDVTLPAESGEGAQYILVQADARDDVPGELSELNNVGASPEISIDAECFDVLEPNNSLDDPQTLELFTEPPVSFTELLACSDNRDFYELCLSDGDFLSVTAAFNPFDGDLDMKLYADGDEIDRSEGIDETENVGVDYVAGDRCYQIEVYVAGRDREVPYTLTVDTGRAPDELACSRIEEPSDGFGESLRLRDFLDDCMAICPVEDEDYYYVELSAGSDVSFSLTGLEGAEPPDNLRLTLFSPSRGFLQNTVRATESLDQSVGLNGRHYLRVRSVGDGARASAYCLLVDGIEGTDLQPSDFTLESGVAVPGETIRFEFTLANTRDIASSDASYALYLSVDPVLSEDDILLRQVDMAALDGLSDREEGLRFVVPADLVDGGTFSVILHVDDEEEVEEFNENNNIAIQGLLVLPRCLPDAAEPNNFPVDAAVAADFDGAALSSCGASDTDWFVHTATRPITNVNIDFFDADGDLNLAFYSETVGGGLVLEEWSDGIGDGEAVEVFTTVGERYFIEVSQHSDRSAPYMLTVE